MKGENTEYETIQDARAVVGCQIVICSIATFGGLAKRREH